MSASPLSRWPSEELYGHPYYEQVEVLQCGDALGRRHHVVLARNKHTGEHVALRLLKRTQANLAARELLHHMANLAHQHVVGLREVFLTGEYLVVALEYADGGDVARHLQPGRGLPEGDARWLFQQAVFALDFAHRMRIAHRNVRVDNMLLVGGGPQQRPILKLGDWGLSAECRLDGAHGCPVHPSIHLGPESLDDGKDKNGRPLDARKMDVWSCGVLLYTMLTGTVPFCQPQDSRMNRMERYSAVFQRMRSREYRLPPGLSEDCKDLLSHLLHPDPAERPSMRTVLQHPWCCEGMDSAEMLQCNDALLHQRFDNPVAPELIHEVRALLKEAVMSSSSSSSTSKPQLSKKSKSQVQNTPAVGSPMDTQGSGFSGFLERSSSSFLSAFKQTFARLGSSPMP